MCKTSYTYFVFKKKKDFNDSFLIAYLLEIPFKAVMRNSLLVIGINTETATKNYLFEHFNYSKTITFNN